MGPIDFSIPKIFWLLMIVGIVAAVKWGYDAAVWMFEYIRIVPKGG